MGSGPNYQIYARTNFYNEFTPAGVKRMMPAAVNVIYYICPWNFHEPPDPAAFTASGLSCEVLTPTPQIFYTDALIAELQAKTYEVPTLLIIQRFLPFQIEAWGLNNIQELVRDGVSAPPAENNTR